MNPPARLRTELDRRRTCGERFEEAWPTAIEPGLLLFAAFVVRGLAEDAGGAAAAAGSGS